MRMGPLILVPNEQGSTLRGRFDSFPPKRIEPISDETLTQAQDQERFDGQVPGIYPKSRTVTIEVPEIIAEQYGTQEELRDSLYESMIIREFQKGLLTIRECAQILGLTYEGFIDWLGARKLSFVTATREELEESYNNFEKFMETYQKPS